MNQNAILLGFGADHLATFGIGPAGSLVQGFLCIDPAHRCGCKKGTPCTAPCGICGGVFLDSGVVTDSNGTAPLFPAGSGLWVTNGYPLSFIGPEVDVVDLTTCVTRDGATIEYGYNFQCTRDGYDNPIIILGVVPRYAICCCSDTNSLGYDVTVAWGICGDARPRTSTLTTLSCGTTLSASFSIPTLPAFPPGADGTCGGESYPQSPDSATVTFAVSTPDDSDHACCSPCPIPKKNLTVCWHNVFSGYGSAPLVYTAPGEWNSECSNHLLYSLSCNAGATLFGVTYFLTGDCPTGQPQSCTSLFSGGGRLLPSGYTCKPFLLHYLCTSVSCPVLGDDGYTDFWVTETTCPYGP